MWSRSKLYERQTAAMGLHKLHGLRHAYAQERYNATDPYKELTGWAAPAAGGKTRGQLSTKERMLDHEARVTVTGELGHGRENITVVYLGR